MNEGFGRRLSPSDIRRDLSLQIEDAKRDRFDREKRAMIDRVHAIDGADKALTGRKSEQYSIESGVPLNELFPEGGKVLNIGDPWQTLDLPQVTTIEYETGEEAMFAGDREDFSRYLRSVLLKVETAFKHCRFCIAADEYQARFREAMTGLLSTEGEGYLLYVERAQLLLDEVSSLYQRHLQDEVNRQRFMPIRELWYDLQRLVQALKDAHLMQTVIEPELQRERVRRKGLSQGDREELMRALVAQHRFLKKTKHADFKKATFPDVPYEDGEFDRLIASWSISTHMFPALDAKGFEIYWKEISRVLKRDGVAYLWPIYLGRADALEESLKHHWQQGGDAALLIHEEETLSRITWIWQESFSYALSSDGGRVVEHSTLIIFPAGASIASKDRAVKAILT